jgi:hypothetical protein
MPIAIIVERGGIVLGSCTPAVFMRGVCMHADPFAVSTTFPAVAPDSVPIGSRLRHVLRRIINPWRVIIAVLSMPATSLSSGPIWYYLLMIALS